MAEQRRCYYEILNVDRKADEDEIRRAYKKAALRCHPDRNHGNEEAAALEFKEVQSAYTVLIDPDERAWYDSHRDAILRGDDGGTCAPDELNVFDYFNARVYDDFDDKNTKKGFYNVYRGVFDTLVKEESEYNDKIAKNAPSFGDSTTPWAQVNSFYVFWKNFISSKTFAWKDEYKLNEINDRQYRREAERINLKVRAQARKEYISAVTQLAHHVYIRDPRVAAEKERAEKEKEEKAIEREKREAEAARRRREANKKIWEEAAEREAREAEERAARGEDCLDHGAGLEMLYEKQRQMERAAKKGDKKAMREAAGAHCSTGDTSARSRVVVGGFAGGDDEAGDSDDEDGAGGASMKNAWKCLGCKKNFSTAKTYDEHVKSNKHKTKFKQLEKAGTDTSALLITPDSKSNTNANNQGKEEDHKDEEEGEEGEEGEEANTTQAAPAGKSGKKAASSGGGAKAQKDDDVDSDTEVHHGGKKTNMAAAATAATTKGKKDKHVNKGKRRNDDDDSDEDEKQPSAATKKAPTAKKAAAQKKGGKGKHHQDDSEDANTDGDASSDDDNSSSKKKKKQQHQQEENTQPSAKFQKSKAKAAAAAARKQQEESEDDDEGSSSSEEEVIVTKNKFAFGKKKK